ncbi:hypothetical protein KM043_003587 [Ampulex compressa]|nr:hypothetical protein KM043_003587 [Ampulex compressa]
MQDTAHPLVNPRYYGTESAQPSPSAPRAAPTLLPLPRLGIEFYVRGSHEFRDVDLDDFFLREPKHPGLGVWFGAALLEGLVGGWRGLWTRELLIDKGEGVNGVCRWIVEVVLLREGIIRDDGEGSA